MDNETTQKQAKVAIARLDAIAIKATTWVGSIQSLIVHTALFIASFGLVLLHEVTLDKMLLVLTTILSLEAIYLAIFIQMSVNRQAVTIEEISDDVDELSDDVEEIGKDVDEIAKDVDELSDDVEEVAKDVDEMSKDVDEIAKDVDEIAKDVDELSDDVEEVAKDVDEMSKDVDEIGKDIDEIGKDVDEIGKDIDEISEDIEDIQEHDEKQEKPSLDKIEEMLRKALADLERVKQK